MNSNITVIDKNGNNIIAEGISCIQFVSSGKKYILYTLNEKVDNDLTKMYVGELSDTPGSLDKISDEEWLHIKNTLNGISHGEENPDLKYLNMGEVVPNIGIPKKLAIKPDVKQAFSDKYNSVINGTSINNSTAVQTVESTPSVPQSGTSGFFNNDVLNDGEDSKDNTIVNNETDNSDSIFANPIKPDLTAQTVGPDEIKNDNTNITSEAAVNEEPVTIQPTVPDPLAAPIVPTTELTPTSDALTSVDTVISTVEPVSESAVASVSTPEVATPVPPIPSMPSIPDTKPNEVATDVSNDEINPSTEVNAVVEDLSKEVMADVNMESTEKVVEEIEDSPEPVTLEQMMPENNVKGIGLVHNITKEEALAALELLHNYINQGGISLNNTNEEKEEEVSVPEFHLEDTTGEEEVVPNSEISTMPENLTGPILGADVVENKVSEVVENNSVVDSSIESNIPTLPNTSENINITEVPQTTVVETVLVDNPLVESPVDEASMELVLNGSEEVNNSDINASLETPPIPTIPTLPTNEVVADATPVETEPTSNIISTSVNDINDVVKSEENHEIVEATTNMTNLINLDAIASIPEIEPAIVPSPATVSAPESIVPNVTSNSNQLSNSYVNSDPSGIPVTLPNNYNAQVPNASDSILGPGSLQTDNN